MAAKSMTARPVPGRRRVGCRLATAGLVVGLGVAVAAQQTTPWPQFRGPDSHGVTGAKGLPLTWTATTNVRWSTALPGPGHSSPIVWGDRIFVTAFQGEQPGVLSRFWSSPRGRLFVLCLDRATGRAIWQKEVAADRIEEIHPTNSPASPTPVTDGTTLFVHFGSRGLVAFDAATGAQRWEKALGPYPNEWGSASSPILYGDLLLLNSDTDGDDALLAVDKMTGRTVWRTSRTDVGRAWPTPYVWRLDGRDEIVVSGSRRVKAYDPEDGRELWTVDGLTLYVTPTPVGAHGLLFVASNGPGGNVVMAIRPGGRGNVTSSHVAWRHTRSAPYNSSPVVYGDYLYVVKNGGIMTCFEAESGRVLWQERLPARGDYYASPLAGDGRIYVFSEDGVATVLAAGPTYQVLATNDLGERTMASPAVAGTDLIIRTDERLYAIRGR